MKLLNKTDSLLLSNELDVEATKDNLAKVTEFVESKLEEVGCPMKVQFQIHMAVEEIFVNIASYAYAPDRGTATVRVEVTDEPVAVSITFVDQGVAYDPLARADPDTGLPAEERDVGGLGIFLTKKLMDDVTYAYKDGQNVLMLKKNL